MQPAALARKKENQLAPKGKLSVKLIGARHLSAPSSASRPYVVVTFDQNEFVSREPIHEEAEEVTGVAKLKEESPTRSKSPPPPGNGGSSTSRGARNEDIAMSSSMGNDKPVGSALGRALGQHNRNDSGSSQHMGPVTGPPEPPTSSLTPAPPLPLENLSAYNPTWKHEVFLFVSLIPLTVAERVELTLLPIKKPAMS